MTLRPLAGKAVRLPTGIILFRKKILIPLATENKPCKVLHMSKQNSKTEPKTRAITLWLPVQTVEKINQLRITHQPTPKLTPFCAWLIGRGLEAEEGK